MVFKNLIQKIKLLSSPFGVLSLCIGALMIFWDFYSGTVSWILLRHALITSDFLGFCGEISSIRKGFTLTSASIMYLLLMKRINANNKDKGFISSKRGSLFQKSSVTNALPIILNILFSIIFSYTMIVVYASENYNLPLSYFISIVALCIIVAVDIFFAGEKRTKTILTKIIVISLLLMWASHYKFPNIGSDPWYHMALINDIIREAHIPSAGYEFYEDFPAMHFVVAVLKTVTNLDILNSMIMIGVFEVTSLLFIFCIGKMLFNDEVGLLGTLLAATSNYCIYWRYYIIPMSLGLGLMAMLIYVIVKFSMSKRMVFKFFSLLLPLVLIYTHTIASIIALIAVTGIYLGEMSRHLLSKEMLPVDLRIAMPIYFFVVLISYWSYVAGYFFTEFAHIFNYIFLPPEIYGITVKSLPYQIDPTALLEDISFIFFFGLVIIGSLYCLDLGGATESNRNRLILISGGLSILIFLYAFHLTGILGLPLLLYRWWAFLYLITAVLGAQGLILIYHGFRSSPMKIFNVIIIVLILSIAMIFTSLPGPNPLTNEEPSREYFFDSETEAAHTISNYYDGKITSDMFYNDQFSWIENKKCVDIYNSFIVSDDSDLEGMIVVRNYIFNHDFGVQSRKVSAGGYSSYSVKLNETERAKVENMGEKSRYSKVYENSEVSAYLPQPMKRGE
jgi:hypothetical protein